MCFFFFKFRYQGSCNKITRNGSTFFFLYMFLKKVMVKVSFSETWKSEKKKLFGRIGKPLWRFSQEYVQGVKWKISAWLTLNFLPNKTLRGEPKSTILKLCFSSIYVVSTIFVSTIMLEHKIKRRHNSDLLCTGTVLKKKRKSKVSTLWRNLHLSILSLLHSK